MDVMCGLNGEIDQALCVEAVRLLGLCERRLFPKLLQPPDACQKTLSVKVRLSLSLCLPSSLPLCLFLLCLLFLSFLIWDFQLISIKFPHCILIWPGSAHFDWKKSDPWQERVKECFKGDDGWDVMSVYEEDFTWISWCCSVIFQDCPVTLAN